MRNEVEIVELCECLLWCHIGCLFRKYFIGRSVHRCHIHCMFSYTVDPSVVFKTWQTAWIWWQSLVDPEDYNVSSPTNVCLQAFHRPQMMWQQVVLLIWVSMISVYIFSILRINQTLANIVTVCQRNLSKTMTVGCVNCLLHFIFHD